MNNLTFIILVVVVVVFMAFIWPPILMNLAMQANFPRETSQRKPDLGPDNRGFSLAES